MKKILLILTSCLLIIGSFAQTGQTNVSDSTCFCCNGFYNLPTPKIIGPVVVNCGDKPSYSIKTCPGAAITWSVTTPNSIATGQGTNTIILSPVSGTIYTVTVQIKCGNKIVENKIVVKVNSNQNCTPAFLVTVKQLANGNLEINAVPNMTSGTDHYWGILYNGQYPNCTNPCTGIDLSVIQNGNTFGAQVINGVFSHLGMGSGITGGTSGVGINYQGFPNNSCFKITHYVKCCGLWVRQTQCISFGTSNLKTSNRSEIKSNITIGDIETVENKTP